MNLGVFRSTFPRLFIRLGIYRIGILCYNNKVRCRYPIMNLEQQFIGKIAGNLAFFRQMPNSTYKFQCPYCQTSARHKSGRALKDGDCASYFYEKQSVINFRCHKCGTGKQFHHFLQDRFPNEFIAYVQERERRGTTGKGHNCPTLANALESVGKLKFGKPEFNKNNEGIANKIGETSDKQSLTRTIEDSDHTKEDGTKFIIHDGRHFKFTPCPPATTPEALAGHGAPINKVMNRRERMRRERRGELW